MHSHSTDSSDDNFTVHTIAGGLAGIIELCLMYPIDTVKTRMQSLEDKNQGIIQVLTQMMKTEGAFRPLKGMSIIAITAGPAHGLYFASYELVKRKILKRASDSLTFAAGTAGAVATVVHDAIVNPAEVIKQRLQMENSPYKSITDCAMKVYRHEGVTAFYKSFGAQLLMNIPFQIIHFVTYELCQKVTNPKKQNVALHFFNGAVAGGTAAAATTPLDVCKTLLNTQQEKVRGIVGAIKTIYTVSGPRGFFKGLTARVVYIAPSNAICWSIYETFKYLLHGFA